MFMDAFWIVSSFPSHSWVEMEKCDKLGALFNSRYPPSMKNVATVQCSLSVTSSGQRTSRTVDCRACWPIWTRRHRERCCWSWLQSDWNVSARVLISPKNVGITIQSETTSAILLPVMNSIEVRTNRTGLNTKHIPHHRRENHKVHKSLYRNKKGRFHVWELNVSLYFYVLKDCASNKRMCKLKKRNTNSRMAPVEPWKVVNKNTSIWLKGLVTVSCCHHMTCRSCVLNGMSVQHKEAEMDAIAATVLCINKTRVDHHCNVEFI